MANNKGIGSPEKHFCEILGSSKNIHLVTLFILIKTKIGHFLRPELDTQNGSILHGVGLVLYCSEQICNEDFTRK